MSEYSGNGTNGVFAMQPNSLFKHSGRISVAGTIGAIAKGSVIAVLLGALYGAIAYYSPFFLINMAVLAGAAIAMGALLDKPIQSGHIRNSVVAAFVGLVCGGVMFGAHWLVWIRLSLETWIIDLSTISAALQVIAALGPWSIFDWTPRGGTLYTIWGIEALVLVVLPTIVARNTVRDTPYCEQAGRWAEVDYTKKNFAPADFDAVKQQLLQNPSAIVNLIKEPAEEDSEFLRFGLAKVDGSSLRTITISKIVTKIKDGKVEEDSKTVLNNLMVDSSTFEKVAAACK